MKSLFQCVHFWDDISLGGNKIMGVSTLEEHLYLIAEFSCSTKVDIFYCIFHYQVNILKDHIKHV